MKNNLGTVLTAGDYIAKGNYYEIECDANYWAASQEPAALCADPVLSDFTSSLFCES